MERRVGAAALLVALAAGCSDGGGGSDGGSGEGPRSFSELRAESEVLIAATSTLDGTNGADLPDTGSATYDGVLGVQTATGVALAGDLQLVADFGATDDPISGRVDNIVDSDENPYAGSLDVVASDIDRAVDPNVEPQFTADLDGRVRNDEEGRFRVTGTMEGAFLGDEAAYAGGFVEGESCQGGECVDLTGAFLAED